MGYEICHNKSMKLKGPEPQIHSWVYVALYRYRIVPLNCQRPVPRINDSRVCEM